jgi:hypothetical protein
MTPTSAFVCSETITYQAEAAVLVISYVNDRFVASWECTCGLRSLEPIVAAQLVTAFDLSRQNYYSHCQVLHAD